MALLNNMAQALERGFTNIGRSRAREHLLRQSDRVLADTGFSRELLERGNSAWPWHSDVVATDAQGSWPASRGPAGATSAGVVPFPDATQLETAGSTEHDGLKAA